MLKGFEYNQNYFLTVLQSQTTTYFTQIPKNHSLLLLIGLLIWFLITLTDLLCFCRNEGSLVSALKTLLFFTILMVTLPIGLYFTTKAYVFEGSMKMSSSDSYFYAAIVAVLAVHVVLALFVYVAWNEGAPKGKGKHD
uniref:Vacuolar ATPase assembly factor VMA21 n=1 Tax=Oryzias latipes TaxID=8090 RepID=A0A3P9KHH8_ORYLA